MTSDLSKQMTDKLIEALDQVVSERRNYFSEHPENIPERTSVPYLIDSYSRNNALISGGASLIPGPWGMLAILPEIITVCRNQIALIYDIGMAYGKRDVLTKELIIGILLTALGESAISVIVIKGSKVLVRRASLRVFQKIVALLGGRITQRALKASISKWAPGIGAGAMAFWSHHQTKQIGKKAVEIFEKDIVLSNDPIDENPPSKQEPPSNGVVSARRFEVLRLQAMINLMKADGIVRAEEREFMRIIISNTTLTGEEKTLLIHHMDTGEKFTIDYAAIAASPEDTVGLLIDLITLAKCDGSVHVAEKMYIRQVGRLMGFSDQDIEEMLESINNQAEDRSHIST